MGLRSYRRLCQPLLAARLYYTINLAFVNAIILLLIIAIIVAIVIAIVMMIKNLYLPFD